MTVTLDENVLLGVAGIIFVPLFIFFIKLIIEVGGIKNTLQNIIKLDEEVHESFKEIDELHYEVKILKHRLDHLEREVKKSPV